MEQKQSKRKKRLSPRERRAEMFERAVKEGINFPGSVFRNVPKIQERLGSEYQTVLPTRIRGGVYINPRLEDLQLVREANRLGNRTRKKLASNPRQRRDSRDLLLEQIRRQAQEFGKLKRKRKKVKRKRKVKKKVKKKAKRKRKKVKKRRK